MKHHPIEHMPNLMQRLGKARVDRIRYVGKANTTPLYKSQNIPNTLMEFMQDRQPCTPGCWVDDIIQGVARLEHGNALPLSVSRLFNILQCVELLNTRELMALMDIEKRQAQKYLKATRLIMFAINKHLALTSGSTAV